MEGFEGINVKNGFSLALDISNNALCNYGSIFNFDKCLVFRFLSSIKRSPSGLSTITIFVHVMLGSIIFDNSSIGKAKYLSRSSRWKGCPNGHTFNVADDSVIFFQCLESAAWSYM